MPPLCYGLATNPFHKYIGPAMVCESMVNFWYRNRGMPCDKLKRICFREGYRVSKFDTEIEIEYSATRVREELADASLGC